MIDWTDMAEDEIRCMGHSKSVDVNLTMNTRIEINAYLTAVSQRPVVEVLSYGGRAVVPLDQVEEVIALMQKALQK